jgi:TorA maturation chaperone TorD
VESEEVPDHAATELLFMAMLVAIERQLRAVGDDRELASVLRAQTAFLDQHILAWFPGWTATVQARALLPFYRSLVQLLTRFLEVDRNTLQLLVGAGR